MAGVPGFVLVVEGWDWVLGLLLLLLVVLGLFCLLGGDGFFCGLGVRSSTGKKKGGAVVLLFWGGKNCSLGFRQPEYKLRVHKVGEGHRSNHEMFVGSLWVNQSTGEGVT